MALLLPILAVLLAGPAFADDDAEDAEPKSMASLMRRRSSAEKRLKVLEVEIQELERAKRVIPHAGARASKDEGTIGESLPRRYAQFERVAEDVKSKLATFGAGDATPPREADESEKTARSEDADADARTDAFEALVGRMELAADSYAHAVRRELRGDRSHAWFEELELIGSELSRMTLPETRSALIAAQARLRVSADGDPWGTEFTDAFLSLSNRMADTPESLVEAIAVALREFKPSRIDDQISRASSTTSNSDLITRLDEALKERTAARPQAEEELLAAELALEQWQSGRQAIDKNILTYALPSLCAVFVVLALAPLFMSNADAQRIVLGSGVMIRLLTVFALITVILLLGLSARLESDILGTLLGGIAGYVLGRSQPNSRSREGLQSTPRHAPESPQEAA